MINCLNHQSHMTPAACYLAAVPVRGSWAAVLHVEVMDVLVGPGVHECERRIGSVTPHAALMYWEVVAGVHLRCAALKLVEVFVVLVAFLSFLCGASPETNRYWVLCTTYVECDSAIERVYL